MMTGYHPITCVLLITIPIPMMEFIEVMDATLAAGSSSDLQVKRGLTWKRRISDSSQAIAVRGLWFFVLS